MWPLAYTMATSRHTFVLDFGLCIFIDLFLISLTAGHFDSLLTVSLHGGPTEDLASVYERLYHHVS